MYTSLKKLLKEKSRKHGEPQRDGYIIVMATEKTKASAFRGNLHPIQRRRRRVHQERQRLGRLARIRSPLMKRSRSSANASTE